MTVKYKLAKLKVREDIFHKAYEGLVGSTNYSTLISSR